MKTELTQKKHQQPPAQFRQVRVEITSRLSWLKDVLLEFVSSGYNTSIIFSQLH